MLRIFNSKSRIVGLIASLILIIGAILPWGESMGIPFTGVDDGLNNGLDSGYFVVMFGILSFLFFLRKNIRFLLPLFLGIANLVIAFFYLYKVWDVNNNFTPGATKDFIFGGLAPVDVRCGVILVILGGITLIVLTIINRKKLF